MVETVGQGRRLARIVTAVSGAPIDPLPELEKVIVKVQNFKLQYGQQLALVGAWGALGAWDASKAVTLTWVEGDSWTKYISLPHGLNEVKVDPLSHASISQGRNAYY